MPTFTFTCEQGHPPVTQTVEAASREEAVEQLTPWAKEHITSMHADQPAANDDQIKQILEGGLKEEGAAQAA